METTVLEKVSSKGLPPSIKGLQSGQSVPAPHDRRPGHIYNPANALFEGLNPASMLIM